MRRQSGVPLLQGGIPALFAGAGPSAAFRVLHGALYMPIYGTIKHALRDAGAPAAAAVTAAAAGATIATALVEIPVEAVMLRLKSGTGASFGRVLSAALAAPGGAAGLWAGAAPYVMRHVMFEAVEFVVYEHLREATLRKRAAAAAAAGGHGHALALDASAHASPHSHAGGLDSRTAALLAAAAGAAATLASHPLDVIRVATSLSHNGAAAGAALSARATAAHILRTAGPAGFARGLLPRLATTVPGSVIFFTVYEKVRERIALAEDAAAAAALHAPAQRAVAPLAVAAAGAALAR